MFHLKEAIFRENTGTDEFNFIIFKHVIYKKIYSFELVKIAFVGRDMEEKLLRLNTLLLMNICAISWNKYIICDVNNCMVTAVAFQLYCFLSDAENGRGRVVGCGS